MRTAPPPASWRRWLPPVAALAVFGLLLFVIDRELSDFHLRDVLEYLRSIPADRVAMACAATLASFVLLGVCEALGLRYVGKPLPYRTVAVNSAIASALGHSLGAAALTGGAVRYRLYSRAGVSGLDIATLQAFCSLTVTIALLAVIGASLLGSAQPQVPLPEPALRLAGAALLAAAAAYAAWSSLGRRGLQIRGWTLRPAGPALTGMQIVAGILDMSAAAAALWVLLPGIPDVTFLGFLGVYCLAVVGGIVSYLPGGLGAFESVLLLSLPEVPADELIGAMLAYRAIYYVLPLLLAGIGFAGLESREHGATLARAGGILSRFAQPLAPRVGGALAFICGLVLLVSGATPALDDRIAAMRGWLPLPVVEISHLVGSIAGVGLLVLSRALFRRVREAYRLALWLLAASAVASLLKGLDVEEAALSLAVLAVLWLGRGAFRRPASLVDSRLTPVWIVSIAGALGAVLWIGLFAHRHVELSADLWWTFSSAGDAPRMLRAALATAVVAGAVFAHNLLRPSRPEPRALDATDRTGLLRLVRMSDTTLANAALTGDKRFLLSPQRDAFIMYELAGRSWVALGDPVGERGSADEIAWRFLELADRHGGWPVFYQVSGERLPLYVELGLAPMKIGEEARVPLPDFSLEGSARADLRQSHRRAQRAGAVFEILPSASLASAYPALRQISDSWLRAKATAEKSFSVGAFSEAYLRQFDIAVVRRGDAPVAFANIWTTDTRQELSVDLMRFAADAPHGTMDFLFAELMAWGRSQGYRWFNLGMAPLKGLDTHPLAPAWSRFGGFVSRHGEHFYNFDGLRRYKAKFTPVWEAKYLVTPGGWFVVPRVLMDVSALIAGGVAGLWSR